MGKSFGIKNMSMICTWFKFMDLFHWHIRDF